ncbi:MAG: hypothetical protein H0U75_12295 [Legionella sp.]|nr:hypothetical protein [Legionella sp.]
MENYHMDVSPHPQLLDFLFAFKSKVSAIFKDILGIHDIDHLAVTQIKNHQLLTLSSTPAMEYNLFSTNLWCYDKSYNPQWYHLYTQAFWESLYQIRRYDELYYIKQIKHNLPLGLTLASQFGEGTILYSIASHKSCSHTKELFSTQFEDFQKIGQYCANLFSSLFNDEDFFL